MRIFILSLIAIGTYTSTLTPSAFTREAGYWSSPADEARSDCFGMLTHPSSQRENWYAVTPYIAEFWCTLSNAGFFYVAAKHRSIETAIAGAASAASHMIPKEWLHTVDLLGIGAVLTKCIREYKAVYRNPQLLIPAGIAAGVNALDAYLARTYGYTWPHVLWHITAAACIDQFLNTIHAEEHTS